MEKPCRVLVVDDSAFAQKIITSYLAKTEFEIVGTAKSGTEAIAQFKACTPDITLLDVILPDQTGPETLKAIMEMKPDAKVLMVSSLGTEETVTECLSIGARGFVQKPVDQNTLLSHMRQLTKG